MNSEKLGREECALQRGSQSLGERLGVPASAQRFNPSSVVYFALEGLNFSFKSPPMPQIYSPTKAQKMPLYVVSINPVLL